MENLGFLVFLFIMWAIGQLLKARENRKGKDGSPPRRSQTRQAPQARQPAAADGITLEEWMERVRRGQLPTAQPQPPAQAPQSEAPAPASERDPEAVLQQWRERAGQQAPAPRQSPRRSRTPPARREREAYTAHQDQLQRAAEAERAQAHELAKERVREQEALKRRKAERREAAERQHAGVHQPMGARRRRRRRAVPQRQPAKVAAPPLPEEQPAVHVQRRAALDIEGRKAYAHTRARSGMHLNLSRGGLRNAIVLAEVLGPCVAVRSPKAPAGFARIGEFV